MIRSSRPFHTIYVTSLALAFVLVAPLRAAPPKTLLPPAAVSQINQAADALPPRLFDMVRIARSHPDQAHAVVSHYIYRLGAHGEEAGMIAATVAQELNLGADGACRMAAAVCEGSSATAQDSRIIYSKVARAVSSSKAAMTSDYLRCMAAELGVSDDEARRVTGLFDLDLSKIANEEPVAQPTPAASDPIVQNDPIIQDNPGRSAADAIKDRTLVPKIDQTNRNDSDVTASEIADDIDAESFRRRLPRRTSRSRPSN